MLKMYSFISKIGQLCLSLIFIEIAIEKFLTEKQRSKDDGQTADYGLHWLRSQTQ